MVQDTREGPHPVPGLPLTQVLWQVLTGGLFAGFAELQSARGAFSLRCNTPGSARGSTKFPLALKPDRGPVGAAQRAFYHVGMQVRMPAFVWRPILSDRQQTRSAVQLPLHGLGVGLGASKLYHRHKQYAIMIA